MDAGIVKNLHHYGGAKREDKEVEMSSSEWVRMGRMNSLDGRQI